MAGKRGNLVNSDSRLPWQHPVITNTLGRERFRDERSAKLGSTAEPLEPSEVRERRHAAPGAVEPGSAITDGQFRQRVLTEQPSCPSPALAERQPEEEQQLAGGLQQFAAGLIPKLLPAGGVLWDPFTGSGTVPMVALRMGVPFVAFEIDPETAARARERLG